MDVRHTSATLFAPPFSAFALLLSLAAVAQDAPPPGDVTLEEVVVTARKVPEIEERISASIAVLDAEQLDRAGVRQIADVLRLVPGLSYEYGGFPTDQRASVRGLQSERGRPSVAVLIDGVDLSSENLYVFGGGGALVARLLDVERVEVVKGPQTVLYGRNAFGGAINYVTRQPDHERFEASALASFGQAGRRDLEAGLGGPLGDGRFAWRAYVAAHSLDGFYVNPRTGGELGASESLAGAFALSFRPNERLSIWARYQYTDDESSQAPQAYIAPNARLPVPGARVSPTGPACAPGVVSSPCGRGVFVGNIAAAPADIQLSADPLTGRDFRGNELEQEFGSLTAELSAGPGRVTFLSGWQRNRTDSRLDGDFADYAPTLPPPAVQVGFALQELFDSEHSSQEVRYAFERSRWSGLVGALQYRERYRLLNSDEFYLLNPNSPLRFPSAQFPSGINARARPVPAFPLTVTRRTEHWSAFARLTWQFLDGWQATLSGRYSDDRIDYAQDGFTRQNVSLFNQVPSCPAPPRGSSNCGIAARVTSSKFTPQATLERFDEALWGGRLQSLVTYLTYGEGFKPAGFNTNEITSYADQRYLPERLRAWELGARSRWWDRRLSASVALFHQDYTDQQVGTQRLPPGAVFPVSGITNAASVDSRGAELELEWRPVASFAAALGYAYTRARFVDFVYGTDGRVASSQQQAESQTVTGDFGGNDVGRNAPHAVNFAASFRPAAPWRDTRWVLEGDAQWRAARFVDEANLARLQAYAIVNLRTGIEGENWSVIAFLDNAFDDRTIRTAQRYVDVGTPDNFIPRRSYLALLPEPRNWGIRASWRLP